MPLRPARTPTLALSLLLALPAAAPAAAATDAEPAHPAPPCQQAELTKRLAVADASGVELDHAATTKRVREVARLTASNRSSMLMDVLAERRTEIDAINGAVVRRGRELGVPVPVNETLTRLVRALREVRELQEK